MLGSEGSKGNVRVVGNGLSISEGVIRYMRRKEFFNMRSKVVSVGSGEGERKR